MTTTADLFQQTVEWPENGAQFIITVYQPTAPDAAALYELLDAYNFDRDGSNFEVRVDAGGMVIALMSKPFDDMSQDTASAFASDVNETMVGKHTMVNVGACRFQPSENWPVVYAITLTN